MFKPLASAVILAVCAVALAAPAQAQGGYIVIAGSDSAHAVEVTVGGSHTGLSDVEAYAISHCAARHGASDCHVLAEGRGGCVALSDNGHGLVGGWGPTRNAAGAAAAAKVMSGQPNVDGTRCVVDPDLISTGSFSFVATQQPRGSDGCSVVGSPTALPTDLGPYTFQKGTGCPIITSPLLDVGQKITKADITCLVGADRLTACIDPKLNRGFVLQPSGSWVF